MSGQGGTVKVPSLPPPRPKSPPEYPDLYGKRRELAKVQMLEREIGFLEDELRFVEGLQPASRACKDVADYVTANSDPLMPTTKRVHKSCCFWKWLCGSSCFSFPWICCQGCVPPIEMPSCCDCNSCQCTPCPSCKCIRCSKPKCHCCSCLNSQCFRRPSCSLSCSIPKCPSCSNCLCNGCTSCYPKCLKVDLCSCCTKDCCYSCYIC